MGGPRPPFFGPRRQPLGEETEKTVQDAAPAEQYVMFRRRRQQFNGETETTNQVPAEAPLVPPVPEPAPAKPVRQPSLLEAIIKLVNSILTFKAK